MNGGVAKLESMARQKPNPAVRVASGAAFTPDGKPKPGLQSAISKAVESQRPLVRARLRRMRRTHPEASPTELAQRLDRDFLTIITGSGAAVGATAVVPGIGTAVALGLSAGATVMFMEATALYALSVAELHGVHLEDPERAQTTVMAVMLGEEGTALMQSFAGHALGRGNGPINAVAPVSSWGTALGKNVPISAMKMISSRIQKAFFKRMLVNQAGSMLGRLVPFGIGAVIGAAGNRMMGRSVIRATRTAFGPLPEAFPLELIAVPEDRVPDDRALNSQGGSAEGTAPWPGLVAAHRRRAACGQQGQRSLRIPRC